MKVKNNRGIRIPTRIILSGILLLLQLLLLFGLLYDFAEQYAFAYTLSMVLGVLTVIIILNRKGNPDHKIPWIIFILLLPIFGISVFLLWGGGRVAPHIKKRMRLCEARYLRYLKDDSAVRDRLGYYDLMHARQADYLTRESGYPLYDKSSTEYCPSGEAFLPRVLEELQKAEKYIFIEFFILAEGKMWDDIHAVLKRKAEAGVEVKIIFDDFGSIKRQRKGFVSRLKAEGISICIFNPINPFMNIFMNNRNHRKIIVVDGKVAMTGGINIGDEYINHVKRFGYWAASAVIIKGNAVKSFVAMFCCMWDFITGRHLPIKSYFADAPTMDDGFVIPYSDSPLNDKNPAEGIYMQILNTAQRYVYIATPYLIIDNTMKNMLQMAAKSGIDVRIITPHIPDKFYVHPVTQYNYAELLEAGVKIYEFTPGFIHSKLFISDDKVATVGSVNMDYRSFVFHFECGAWICDSSTVTDIKEHFLSLMDHSREIRPERWKRRPLFMKIKQALFHLFAPFM